MVPIPRWSWRLPSYDWPGNVRELEHAIERAVILASRKRIFLQDVPAEVRTRSRQRAGKTFDLDQQERELIRQAIERFGGSWRQAAEALGVSPVTLWRKSHHYKLDT